MVSKALLWCAAVLIGIVALCFSYNLYTSFFPTSLDIIADDAEYLHVAYLLGQNQRPFVDFMENHPMLFSHYLWWLHDITGVKSTVTWNAYARVTLLVHLVLCFLVIGLFSSKLVKNRPRGLLWITLLLLSWSATGLYEEYFRWIWQIRPDFISYAYTLLGCYLAYLYFCPFHNDQKNSSLLLLVLGGAFIGFGNAILPKGTLVLLAIALALVTSQLYRWKHGLSYLCNKRIVTSLFIFAGTIAISFVSGMLLDCYLSGIPPEKWIAGVLLLNTRKHTIYTAYEDNPITSITTAFSLSFLLLLALVIWGMWRLCRFRVENSEVNGEGFIGLFCLFVITVNLLTPSYTNGATWSYNFIPSIFAAALVYVLLLIKVWRLWRQENGPRGHNYRRVVLFAVYVLFLVQIVLPQYTESAIRYQSRQVKHREINMLRADDFLQEEIMPPSLVYLAQFPNRMPVKARHWGYHFMLVLDMDFWRDCYRLGLGPNPEEVWGNGFGDYPPDALAFSSAHEILEFVLALRRCQAVDATWLFDEIKNNYVVAINKGVSLYVRRDKAAFLQERGWRIGQPDHVLFTYNTPLEDY